MSGISTNIEVMKSVHKPTANLFSLPAEVRWMIWEFCIPAPRAVTIKMSVTSGVTVSDSATPNLLHICHESRQAALNHYELAFPLLHIPLDKPSIEADNVPSLYFDYSRDILYFNSILKDAWQLIDGITGNSYPTPFNRHQQKRWLGNVKSLAIDLDAHWDPTDLLRFRLLDSLPLYFPCLEQLLVMHDHRKSRHSLEVNGSYVEVVKELTLTNEIITLNPRKLDFVVAFRKRVKERKMVGHRPWKAPQMKFVELVRERA